MNHPLCETNGNGWAAFCTALVLGALAGLLVVLAGLSQAHAATPDPFPWQCKLTITNKTNGKVEVETFPALDQYHGLKRGREKAADWWGKVPGIIAQLECWNKEFWKGKKMPNGQELDKQRQEEGGDHVTLSSPEGSGHSGLHWRQEVGP